MYITIKLTKYPQKLTAGAAYPSVGQKLTLMPKQQTSIVAYNSSDTYTCSGHSSHNTWPI